MSQPRPDRTRRWLLPAALLLAAPKCLLCVLAYAGLVTGLGLGDQELCGGGGRTDWLLWLALAGGGVLLARLVFRRSRHP